MTLITAILQHLIPGGLVVSLVIIFQPELRRGLGYLGRTTFKVDFSLADSEKQRATEVIAHIISAVAELSREKTGALIVIEPPEGERDYLSPGTTMNADVSGNLLLSIFVNKSPLHDGAAVIRASKIVAARSDFAYHRQSQTELPLWHKASRSNRSFRRYTMDCAS